LGSGQNKDSRENDSKINQTGANNPTAKDGRSNTLYDTEGPGKKNQLFPMTKRKPGSFDSMGGANRTFGGLGMIQGRRKHGLGEEARQPPAEPVAKTKGDIKRSNSEIN